MKFIFLLATVLIICSVFCEGLPQLKDDKAIYNSDPSQVNNMKVEGQGSFAETNFQAEHDRSANGMSNDMIRSKRDVQKKNVNQNCCGTNSGRSNGSFNGTSNCVCNTYPHNTMNNNNNNMGATVFNSVYYICNCGTNTNPNNAMNCCVPKSNNRNCNCCTGCQCGCNNGTNICICSGNSCCSTSQSNSRGNVCYTFDKTCCNMQNTKNLPLNTGFANHHGPIFVYNNYHYYCKCTPNSNMIYPSTCSTTCTCGCQPATVQPFVQQFSTAPTTIQSGTRHITDKLKDDAFNLLESTKKLRKLKKYLEEVANSITYPPIFTNSNARSEPGFTVDTSADINFNLNTGDNTQTGSMKSNPKIYTYTFSRSHTHTPRRSEQTQMPTTATTRTKAFRSNDLYGDGRLRGLDLSELLRNLKK